MLKLVCCTSDSDVTGILPTLDDLPSKGVIISCIRRFSMVSHYANLLNSNVESNLAPKWLFKEVAYAMTMKTMKGHTRQHMKYRLKPNRGDSLASGPSRLYSYTPSPDYTNPS